MIDEETEKRLRADLDSRRGGVSFSSIALLLGAICLCFAAMTFVAANWQEMSSRVRLLLLAAGLWAAYGSAFIAASRGRPWIAQTMILLGCGLYGASIMLVGQIYHIAGEPTEAVWLWAAGTIAAAALTRSTPALALAIMLVTLWTAMVTLADDGGVNPIYLAWWLACAAGAWWLRSRFCAHLCAAGLLVWTGLAVVWTAAELETFTYGLVAVCAAFLLISLALFSDGRHRWLRGFEQAAMAYLLLLIGGLLVPWYGFRWVERSDLGTSAEKMGVDFLVPAILFALTAAIAILAWARKAPNRYDQAFCAVWCGAMIALIVPEITDLAFVVEAVLLAISVWIIRMGARQETRSMSVLGYLAFAVVMLAIYFQTAGTLLGTSGFYLGAGILLVLAAWALPRFVNAGIDKPGMQERGS